MVSRRKMLIATAGVLAGIAVATWPGRSLYAQAIVQIERGSPDRQAILDVVRASVQRRLGIKIIFMVERLTLFDEWAFAALRPRTEAGNRIDYRRTLYAKDYEPDLDSDTIDVLLRRAGPSWSIVEEAFLPTDVVWEEWETKYKLPRALFFVE